MPNSIWIDHVNIDSYCMSFPLSAVLVEFLTYQFAVPKAVVLFQILVRYSDHT